MSECLWAPSDIQGSDEFPVPGMLSIIIKTLILSLVESLQKLFLKDSVSRVLKKYLRKP